MTLDLLLPAHVTCLRTSLPSASSFNPSAFLTGTYSRYPPPFRIAAVVQASASRLVVRKQGARKRWRNRRTVGIVGTKNPRRLVHYHGHLKPHADCISSTNGIHFALLVAARRICLERDMLMGTKGGRWSNLR